MTSTYIHQPAESTKCSACGTSVTLLCREDCEMSASPAFYICFGCRKIAQVGVGPVEEDSEYYGKRRGGQ